MPANKAIFLDRDGVVNRHSDSYVKSVDEFEILEGVGDAIRRINGAGYKAIIVTNQSVINRGLATQKDVQMMHDKLRSYLEKRHAFVDGIYYCPHTPEQGCQCRKPRTGMLLQAQKEFDLSFPDSWMVGDSQVDIEAGRRAGCSVHLMQTNGSLASAIDEILAKSI
jgi:D-glycero-D-manno-heptose 1,7-bisphosphate phosphatase